MADAERKQDHRGSGIELSTRPQYQELQANPGLEVLAPSELEVVPPKPSYSPTTYGQEKKLGDDAYYSPQTPYHVAPPYGFNSPYDNAPLMAPPVPARMAGATERRVLGLKRQTFFIILAIAIFLAVVAVAVGVGVGIAMRGKTDSPAARYVVLFFSFPLYPTVVSLGRKACATAPSHRDHDGTNNRQAFSSSPRPATTPTHHVHHLTSWLHTR